MGLDSALAQGAGSRWWYTPGDMFWRLWRFSPACSGPPFLVTLPLFTTSLPTRPWIQDARAVCLLALSQLWLTVLEWEHPHPHTHTHKPESRLIDKNVFFFTFQQICDYIFVQFMLSFQISEAHDPLENRIEWNTTEQFSIKNESPTCLLGPDHVWNHISMIISWWTTERPLPSQTEEKNNNSLTSITAVGANLVLCNRWWNARLPP